MWRRKFLWFVGVLFVRRYFAVMIFQSSIRLICIDIWLKIVISDFFVLLFVFLVKLASSPTLFLGF